MISMYSITDHVNSDHLVKVFYYEVTLFPPCLVILGTPFSLGMGCQNPGRVRRTSTHGSGPVWDVRACRG